MVFSGPFLSAFEALKAADSEGYAVGLVPSPWHDEALAEAFIELVDVSTDLSGVPEEWASVTLANAIALMERHSFRLRSSGTPAGSARRL